MNKQQLVIFLLIIAIVLSAINVVVSLGFDASDLQSLGQNAQQQEPQSDSGNIGIQILPPGGNAS